MRKKMILLLVLSLFMTHNAFAQSNMTEADMLEGNFEKKQLVVEQLINQLIEVRLKLASNEEDSLLNLSYSTLASQEAQIEKLLQDQGVRHATQEDLNKIGPSLNGIQPSNSLRAAPPSWGPYANVDILTWGEENVNYNGTNNKLWIFYAVPKNGGGAPLVRHYDWVNLQSQPVPHSTWINKVFTIYAQKTIGQIPIVTWLPYEYFWPSRPTFDSYDDYEIKVSYASTMKYVFKYFSASDVWNLVASANNVSFLEKHSIVTFYNNQLQSPTIKDRQRTVWADGWDNLITTACQSIGGYSWSSVDTQIYKNGNGSTVLSVYPHFAKYAPDLI